MQHTKQLKKVDAQTNIALNNYETDDSKTKFVKYLDIDPNLPSKETAVLALTTIPLMMAGLVGPTLLYLQLGATPPGAEPLSYLVAALGMSGVFLSSSFQQGKLIKSAFKYNLGYKLSREKTKELRRIQKSLKPGETRIVPAAEVFETADIIDFTAAKGLELDILVSKERVALQWGKPLSSGDLWDETVDDMVDMFALEVNGPERGNFPPMPGR